MLGNKDKEVIILRLGVPGEEVKKEIDRRLREIFKRNWAELVALGELAAGADLGLTQGQIEALKIPTDVPGQSQEEMIEVLIQAMSDVINATRLLIHVAQQLEAKGIDSQDVDIEAVPISDDSHAGLYFLGPNKTQVDGGQDN